MKSYYRVMLGQGSVYAAECFDGGFVGADFGIEQDLSGKLPDQWREFNKEFISVFLDSHPGKGRISAGLACGALWTISKGFNDGDLILSPDGTGAYRVGEVKGSYYYAPGTNLPHRRPVNWLNVAIDRNSMSEPLRRSAGSIGTVSNITQYHEEITGLVGGPSVPKLLSTDPSVEDPSSFAMEAHLEEFLIKNWSHTELGQNFDIYEEDGAKAQQYQTDTGPMDILAISKDRKRLLVVELKKGRTSDAVVGQTLRYMGYVANELAESTQTVEGAILAHEDDQRIRRALSMIPNVTFYLYRVSFKLVQS